MGLVKRRLYKRERSPARTKGQIGRLAPNGCLDASDKEVTMAVFAWGQVCGVIIGRGLGYDSIRDEYTTIAKSKKTRLVSDFKCDGKSIAELIYATRKLAGERLNQLNVNKYVEQAVM